MATLVLRQNMDSYSSALRPNEAGYPGASARMTMVSWVSENYTYLFPYAPVEVEYSNVGSEYQEIERPGNYSLVDRRAPSLLKVSFEFRVAHRPSNGLQSIERDLDILRTMATTDAPVALIGLGGYFAGYAAGTGTELPNVLFRITDLSVKVVRRGDDNVPWQADCKVDLIEDRNPFFIASVLAPIVYANEPIAATATTGGNGNKKATTPAPTTYGTYADKSKEAASSRSDQGDTSKPSTRRVPPVGAPRQF